jgi:hypothetical protein
MAARRRAVGWPTGDPVDRRAPMNRRPWPDAGGPEVVTRSPRPPPRGSGATCARPARVSRPCEEVTALRAVPPVSLALQGGGERCAPLLPCRKAAGEGTMRSSWRGLPPSTGGLGGPFRFPPALVPLGITIRAASARSAGKSAGSATGPRPWPSPAGRERGDPAPGSRFSSGLRRPPVPLVIAKA